MHAYSIFYPARCLLLLLLVTAAVVNVGWCWLLLYIIYCYCWLVGGWILYYDDVKYMLHGVLKKIDMLIMY